MKTGGTSRVATISLTALAMLAFAANSILCRLALTQTDIDPASFTIVRIGSGAAMLCAIATIFRGGQGLGGSWRAAFALFAYAAAFSFAYMSLPAGAGALLLFGAVQATMVIAGIIRGDHPAPLQWLGLAVALAGLVVLLAPGVSAPPLVGAALMLAAGTAWGAYSILGRRSLRSAGGDRRQFSSPRPYGVGPRGACGDGEPSGRGMDIRLPFGRSSFRHRLRDLVRRPARLERGRGRLGAAQRPGDHRACRGDVLGEPITSRLGLASLAVLGGIALVIVSRSRRP